MCMKAESWPMHEKDAVVDALSMSCKQHPRYKVIRCPRLACESCWAMWFEKQGREYFGW